MRLARFVLPVSFLCITACTNVPVSVTRAGDPRTEGNVQAISSADYQALLSSLRERLRTVAPSASIKDVYIFDAASARASFARSGNSYTLLLTKRRGIWHPGVIERERPPTG